jgi:hypothetical protein
MCHRHSRTFQFQSSNLGVGKSIEAPEKTETFLDAGIKFFQVGKQRRTNLLKNAFFKAIIAQLANTHYHYAIVIFLM